MSKTKLGKPKIKQEKLNTLLRGKIALLGLTQADVGATLNVDRRTAGGYYGCFEKLPLEKLLKLSKALDISIDELRTAITY